MNGRFDGHFRDINSRMATTGELRGWAGVISALLAIAVGVILKYG
jgi:hypothetical protein